MGTTSLRRNTMSTMQRAIMRRLRDFRIEMYSKGCTDNRAETLRVVIHKLEKLLGLPLTTFGPPIGRLPAIPEHLPLAIRNDRHRDTTPCLRVFREIPGT